MPDSPEFPGSEEDSTLSVGRMTVRTSPLREKFLTALAGHGIVGEACRDAGISKNAAYEWRRDDPDFAQDWEKALDQSTEKLERIAVDRAVKQSDSLMQFVLKARKPETYRERVEHTGPRGGPIEVHATDDTRHARIREILGELGGAGALVELGLMGDVIDVESLPVEAPLPIAPPPKVTARQRRKVGG
jgi:hypothetical protein